MNHSKKTYPSNVSSEHTEVESHSTFLQLLKSLSKNPEVLEDELSKSSSKLQTNMP